MVHLVVGRSSLVLGRLSWVLGRLSLVVCPSSVALGPWYSVVCRLYSGRLVFVPWSLVFGRSPLAFILWYLGVGRCSLVVGVWSLVFGLLSLAFAPKLDMRSSSSSQFFSQSQSVSAGSRLRCFTVAGMLTGFASSVFAHCTTMGLFDTA